MTWRIPTDTEIAARIVTRIDIAPTGVGIVVDAIDNNGRRGVAA
jgi:hypothetical protein